MQMLNLIVAFNLGLLSTLHCLGMCGGIIGALALGSDSTAREAVSQKKRYLFVMAYNCGRIISYTLAGAITGMVIQQTTILLSVDGHRYLQIIAAVILVIIGLHLAEMLPHIRRIEALGLKLWRLMQPLTRHFFPVRTVRQALSIGILWGWLPCALVYSTLLWSAASGDAVQGALLMLAFGLGTLPGMISAGLAGAGLMTVLKKNNIRRWAGIIIILFGLASPFLYTQHDHHMQHDVHVH